MRKKIQKLKRIWKVIVSDWKTRYRLVFSNEQTHEQRFVIKRITIKKMVVVTIIAAFLLIALTALLISLTPLRFYVPGYTSKKEYQLYRQTVAKIDSLEGLVAHNQQYLDNFLALLNDKVTDSENMCQDTNPTPSVHYTVRDRARMQSVEALEEEAEMILSRVDESKKSGSGDVPTIDEGKITHLSLYPPALGVVTRPFNPSAKHYGIDISGTRNSPVMNVADGVVVFSGFDMRDGNMIIVQHPGSIVSIYKHNETLLKTAGARVQAGTPIATMGSSGLNANETARLHFELWYNGFPLNPLDYLVVE